MDADEAKDARIRAELIRVAHGFAATALSNPDMTEAERSALQSRLEEYERMMLGSRLQ